MLAIQNHLLFLVRPLLALLFLSVVWLIFYERKKFFPRIPKRHRLALAALILASFFFTLYFNSVPGDSADPEWEYKIKAVDYLNGWQGGSVHGQGYPFLLSIFFSLFGANDFAVLLFNALCGSITVYLSYLLGKKYTSRPLLLAGIVGLFPYHILISGTGGAEPLAGSIMLIIIILIENPYSALAFGYLVSVRPEFLLFAPVLFYFTRNRKKWVILFAISLLPLLIFIETSWIQSSGACMISDSCSVHDANYLHFNYLRNMIDYFDSFFLIFLLFIPFIIYGFRVKILNCLILAHIIVHGILLPFSNMRYIFMFIPFFIILAVKGMRFKYPLAISLALIILLFLTVDYNKSDVTYMVEYTETHDNDIFICNPFVTRFEFPGREADSRDFIYYKTPSEENLGCDLPFDLTKMQYIESYGPIKVFRASNLN